MALSTVALQRQAPAEHAAHKRRPPQRRVTGRYQPPPCLAGGPAGTLLAEALAWEVALAGEAAGGALAVVPSQAMD